MAWEESCWLGVGRGHRCLLRLFHPFTQCPLRCRTVSPPCFACFTCCTRPTPAPACCPITVATALSEGESKRKHCVMVEVMGQQVGPWHGWAGWVAGLSRQMRDGGACLL